MPSFDTRMRPPFGLRVGLVIGSVCFLTGLVAPFVHSAGSEFRGHCSSIVPTTAHYSIAKKCQIQRPQVPRPTLAGPSTFARIEDLSLGLQASPNLRTATAVPVGRRRKELLPTHNLSCSKTINSSSSNSRRAPIAACKPFRIALNVHGRPISLPDYAAATAAANAAAAAAAAAGAPNLIMPVFFSDTLLCKHRRPIGLLCSIRRRRSSSSTGSSSSSSSTGKHRSSRRDRL